MYERPGGKLYCIEANPRTSTNLMAFYNHPELAQSFFEPGDLVKSHRGPIKPLKTSKMSYWIWNEVGESVLGPVRFVTLFDACLIYHAGVQCRLEVLEGGLSPVLMLNKEMRTKWPNISPSLTMCFLSANCSI